MSPYKSYAAPGGVPLSWRRFPPRRRQDVLEGLAYGVLWFLIGLAAFAGAVR